MLGARFSGPVCRPDFATSSPTLFELSVRQGEFWRRARSAADAAALAVHRRVDDRRGGAGGGGVSAGARFRARAASITGNHPPQAAELSADLNLRKAATFAHGFYNFRAPMIIAGSFWRKVVVTAVAAVGFVSLYEATMLDSQDAALGGDGQRDRRHAAARSRAPGCRSPPPPTARALTTAAGVAVQTGIAAADPALLPVGSVVEIDSPDAALQRHLHHHGYRARRSRGARSTSTCGAATRRSSSAAGPSA